MKREKNIIVVKRSCLTGKIVWIYRGSSYEGARLAYWRACKHEVRRVRSWASRMAERRRQLMRLLTGSDSSSSSSILARKMTPEQRKAAREIIQMGKQPPPRDSAFYDHIVEEARRRNWRSNRWKDNREKMFRYGKTHTPCEYKSKKKSTDISTI